MTTGRDAGHESSRADQRAGTTVGALRSVQPAPAGGAEADPAQRLRGLLGQAARGQESAFAELYRLTSARVHGLALRVVRDPAQAAEVTQEVFVDVWTQSARYDPTRGSVLSWMMTIAHRRAVDRVRREQSGRERDTRYVDENAETDYDMVSETAERRLDAERVRTALGSLTELQRESLRLAYFGGYTHTEVARLLDVPLGTVKTRLRDGLIRLRDVLEVQP